MVDKYVPIICLDDDSEDDDLKIDKDYKFPLHHLNGESETREFYMSSCDSKRSMLGSNDGKPISNRVSKERKRKHVDEYSRVSSLGTVLESIQRDNRVAERRKRKLAELEASRVVPLVQNQERIQRDKERIQRDNNARGMSELKVETLWDDVPLVRTQQKSRVSEKSKRRLVGLDVARVSRAVPLVQNQESIRGDNKASGMTESKVETSCDDVPLVIPHQDYRVAEQSKRRLVESEAARVSRVPLVRIHENVERDNEAREMSESKAETLSNVPLVRTQLDYRVSEQSKRRLVGLEAARVSRYVPFVQERDIKAREVSVSKVETLYDVPLVRTQEVIERDKNEVGNSVELKVETLSTDPLVGEQTKKKIHDETKSSDSSRVVPVEVVNRVTKIKDETSRFVQIMKGDKEVFVRTSKKNVEESVAIVDKDYISYLTWLVDSLKELISEPMSKLQNDPVPDTRNESTIVSEKALLVKVKVEPGLESFSDDDDNDIIAISDSPFLDGKVTPFVASKAKNVINLEKERTEDESCSSTFKKKLMDVLEKPFDEAEMLRLSGRASMKRLVTRCRELRKGRESSYETDVLGKSYLEKFSDFDEVYKRVDGDDKAKLELLRGFFFYLENVSQDGAFRPWTKSFGFNKDNIMYV